MAATYYILKAGIAPPDLREYPEQVRLMFWGWVTELGLKQKDKELAAGLNAKGQPLPPVSLKTRKHRRSAMTASGKGDRNAPYLMPGRGLSRTRSLLAGKPHTDYAEFWWRYDAFTGDSWAKILSYHARRGERYNVIGLSPRGVSAVAQEAQKKWAAWKAGRLQTSIPAPSIKAPPVTMKVVGRTDLRYVTPGVGKTGPLQQAIDQGQFSGFMTADEWKKHWRQKAAVPRLVNPAGTSQSVRKGSSNVILQHVWGAVDYIKGVFRIGSTKLDRAVATLVDTMRTMPTLSAEQLIAVVGDEKLFGEAITEAMKRKLITVAKTKGGGLVFKVVG